MKNCILIHGIGGLERENYFPHIVEVCKDLGLDVDMPSLGSYREGTNYELWKKYFDEYLLTKINDQTIIIAQSLGTQFAVKYLVEKNLKIGLYISCAGPYDILKGRETAQERIEKFKPSSKYFKLSEEEYQHFKEMDFPKYFFYSNDDVFYEQENLERYITAIGGKNIFLQNKGHFQFENGQNFAELENFLTTILK